MRSIPLLIMASLPTFYVVDVSVSYISKQPLEVFAHAATLLPQHLAGFPPLSTEPMAMATGSVAVCVLWLGWAYALRRAELYTYGEEHGTAGWASPSQYKALADPAKPDQNLILTDKVSIATTTRLTSQRRKTSMANLNTLVIGGPGSGKTRGYVLPNLMQLNASYFVTDPKGTVIRSVGWLFEREGYRIRSFNTVNVAESCHYNPLAYIKTETDLRSFITCLLSSTTDNEKRSGDQFWENSEVMLYTALISYLLDHCDPEDRNLPNLLLLLSLADIREDDPDYQSPLDLLFYELETGMRFVEIEEPSDEYDPMALGFADKQDGRYRWIQVAEPVDPADPALANYRKFKQGAGKTLQSILISCNVRLAPIGISSVSDLLRDDEMDLDSIGEPDSKDIVFGIMSDTDSSFDFLFALLMTQTMQVLTRRADREATGALPTPVHFILDEFANIGRIPDFTRSIAVVRSRNIHMSIIIQSISQLKKSYGDHDSETIIDCCQTTLFLGGKSTQTNEMVSKMLGKQTILVSSSNETRGASSSRTRSYNTAERDLMTPEEVGRIADDEALVMIAGHRPVRDRKYRLERHRRYPLIDANNSRRRINSAPYSFLTHRDRHGKE